MRILFDQGTPVPLRDNLAGHVVQTVFELGWSNLANGALLASAEDSFDLLINNWPTIAVSAESQQTEPGHPRSHDHELATHQVKHSANQFLPSSPPASTESS